MTFECMVYENALRQRLTTEAVGDASLVRDGMVPVPQGPGLGVTVNRDVLNAHRITG
jgi:galactonate dehydratase